MTTDPTGFRSAFPASARLNDLLAVESERGTDMTTTTSTLTARVIREAVDSVDSWASQRMYDGGYAGRNMPDETCVAVVVENLGQIVALGAQIAMVIAQDYTGDGTADEAIDEALDLIARAKVDNLGMDYVVYWPNIPAEDAS